VKKQTSIRLSDAAVWKLTALTERYGNQTTVIEVALDRLYTTEVQQMATKSREFWGYNPSIIGGDYTEEEMAAARAVGVINVYRRPLFDVITEREAKLPDGWRLSPGRAATHEYHLSAPDIPMAANEPILMGFVEVVSGDPHFPVWLWKARNA